MSSDINPISNLPQPSELPDANKPDAPAAPTSSTMIKSMDEFDKMGNAVKDPKTGKSLTEMLQESIFTSFKNSQDASMKRMKAERQRRGN